MKRGFPEVSLGTNKRGDATCEGGGDVFQINDFDERRKAQNRAAQRKYREKLKKLKEDSNENDAQDVASQMWATMMEETNNVDNGVSTMQPTWQSGSVHHLHSGGPCANTSSLQSNYYDEISFWEQDSDTTSPSAYSSDIAFKTDSDTQISPLQRRPSVLFRAHQAIHTTPPINAYPIPCSGRSNVVPQHQSQKQLSNPLSSLRDTNWLAEELLAERQRQQNHKLTFDALEKQEFKAEPHGSGHRDGEPNGFRKLNSAFGNDPFGTTSTQEPKSSPREESLEIVQKLHLQRAEDTYRQGKDISLKQKIHLGGKAEQMVANLVELYDFGVCLELCERDPEFKRMLQVVRRRFVLLLGVDEEYGHSDL